VFLLENRHNKPHYTKIIINLNLNLIFLILGTLLLVWVNHCVPKLSFTVADLAGSEAMAHAQEGLQYHLKLDLQNQLPSKFVVKGFCSGKKNAPFV